MASSMSSAQENPLPEPEDAQEEQEEQEEQEDGSVRVVCSFRLAALPTH